MKLLKLGSVLFFSLLCCLGAGNQIQRASAEMPQEGSSVTTDATEAPAGFDNLTNGMSLQSDDDAARAKFEEVEMIAEGIGPVYNALSCAECHANPVTGGNSQVFEMRAGHFDHGVFTDHPGGSLIQSRAVDASIQERVLDGNEVRALRASTSTLGLGFVEAISSEDIINNANNEPHQSRGAIQGQVVQVPIAESPGATRAGRFGWKDQQASLLSFSGDAYLNEMGITTPLDPTENTSNGNDVSAFDPPPNPDDADNDDLEAFTLFMRSTKVPPRDTVLAATPAAQAGANTFNQIGCAICHTTTWTTVAPGTVLNGGTYTVPPEIGNKIIHPYSDFALHDIGVGDGIVQGLALTRNRMRTALLWGLRTKNRFMHDGTSLTFDEAIRRHAGEASNVIQSYRNLSSTSRNNLLTFLRSL
jgi:CxxC motif-containing protein (DUF1111 family)